MTASQLPLLTDDSSALERAEVSTTAAREELAKESASQSCLQEDSIALSGRGGPSSLLATTDSRDSAA